MGTYTITDVYSHNLFRWGHFTQHRYSRCTKLTDMQTGTRDPALDKVRLLEIRVSVLLTEMQDE